MNNREDFITARVSLTKKGSDFLSGGHVWVYADEITAVNGTPVDGELVDVITEGEFYEPGTAVRVVAVTGGRTVVRKEEKK